MTMTPYSFPSFSRVRHREDDALDDLVDVHDLANRLLAGLRIRRFFLRGVRTFDVFDADDEAGLAGDGDAVGEPAGAAAHRLDEEIAAVRGGIGDQVADFFAEEVDGRKVAEGEVDAAVVVVDRLGEMDDGNAASVGRELLLIELELVGGFERVVAADRDQRIDADRSQRLVDGLAAASSAPGLLRCDGCETFLPGFVRAVPMMMPCELRVRLSICWLIST